jgi:DNA-binding transcriptional LysR family regulator
VLTVPNFMLGLAVVAQSDLVAAMPRTFVAMHRARFGLTQAELPLALVNLPIYAITPRAANDDLGLAWLLEQLTETAQATYGARRRRH